MPSFRSSRFAVSVAVSLVPFAATVHAADADPGQAAAQAQLRLLSEDLGSMVAYKPLIPSGSTGIVGFDVGAAVMVRDELGSSSM